MAKSKTRTIACVPLPPVAQIGAARRPFVLALTGAGAGEPHALAEGRDSIIGRADESDILIDDEEVSRRHAALRVDGDRVELRDLGSSNGTFVAGARVTACQLREGDRFQLGSAFEFKLVYYDATEEQCARRLANGALRDPLTGLHNRRYFAERLTAEVEAARRFGQPLSLLVLDVDHFKHVNDVYGHPTGDEALRMVAGVLRESIRASDTAARYGGEEFVVLARGTNVAGATLLGDRLRRRVATSSFLAGGVPRSLTVSVGVAELGAQTTAEGLIAAADAALYRAKQGGRNRVVVAS